MEDNWEKYYLQEVRLDVLNYVDEHFEDYITRDEEGSIVSTVDKSKLYYWLWCVNEDTGTFSCPPDVRDDIGGVIFTEFFERVSRYMDIHITQIIGPGGKENLDTFIRHYVFDRIFGEVYDEFLNWVAIDNRKE